MTPPQHPPFPAWERCVGCDGKSDTRFDFRLPNGSWMCRPCAKILSERVAAQ